MRTSEEIMECILDTAKADPSILAVGLQGSRSRQIDVDRYSDFDVVFVVRSLQPYLQDKEWIRRFGEILILQTPDDGFDHPSEPRVRHKFTWLMQFTDLSRIDLTLIECADPAFSSLKMKVILDKEGIYTGQEIQGEAFPFRFPREKEYRETVNEFWWITFYVAKGICRDETPYARSCFDILLEMTGRMLEWKIGIETDGRANLGKFMRHLRDHLPIEDFTSYEACFPTLSRADITAKLINIMTFFAWTSLAVGDAAGFGTTSEKTGQIQETVILMISDANLKDKVDKSVMDREKETKK